MSRLRELLRKQQFIIVAVFPVYNLNTELIVDRVKELRRRGADFVELRLDFLPRDNYLVEVVDSVVPEVADDVIVTVRGVSEGGARSVDFNVKKRVIKKTVGLSVVDVELKYLLSKSLEVSGDVIASTHYYNGAPKLSELLRQAEQSMLVGALVYKVAVKPRGYDDIGNLALLILDSLKRGFYVAAMPMGGWLKERLALALLGSKLLYCNTGETIVQGQPSLEGALRLKEILGGEGLGLV